jgi:hypothetical protein
MIAVETNGNIWLNDILLPPGKGLETHDAEQHAGSEKHQDQHEQSQKDKQDRHNLLKKQRACRHV